MNFETEFWPWYQRAHQRLSTRVAHAIATLTCGGFVASALISGPPWLALLGPCADYAIAQLSHRHWERNSTHPWKHPWLHLRAELRLFALTIATLAGRRRPRDVAVKHPVEYAAPP